MDRIPTHPGEILKDELEVRGLGISQFAKLLQVPSGRIGQILACKRAITPDTAIRLAQYFGTSPEVWMNLQIQYDLAVAKQKMQKVG